MRQRILGSVASLALFTLAILAGAPAQGEIVCTTYQNSQAAVIWNTAVCAYTGGFCDECIDMQTGAYCVGEGENRICSGPDHNW